jgi:hypothetical protein
LLLTASRSSTRSRLLRHLIWCGITPIPVLEQSGVDLFGAEVGTCGINQRPSGQGEAVCDEYGVDGEVRCFIPESRITITAAALMTEDAVHDFMRQCPFQLRRLELAHKGRVVDNPGAIRRHRGQTAGYQLQPQA